MEQDFRFNQVKGWTDKLTPDMVPAQFVQELETFLAKGERPLVHLKDDIVTELGRKGANATLYAASLEDTKRITSGPFEVQFLKGTRKCPDIKLLASVTSPTSGFIGIPVCDLRHLTPAEQAKIEEEKRRQREREEFLNTFNGALSDIFDLRNRAGKQLEAFFDNASDLALYYVRYRQGKEGMAPHISLGTLDELEKMCSIIKIHPIKENNREPQRFLDVVFKDVTITFHPDRVPSKMHKELDGAKYSLGDIYCYLSVQPKTLIVPGLFEYRLSVEFGAKALHNGLLHPHIQRNGDPTPEGIRMGRACWGSYEKPLKELSEKMDVLGMIRLIQDYLTSCSESGWYGSVNYWADEERRKKFCACGLTKITRGVVKCEHCSWRRDTNDGVIIEEAPRVADTAEAPRG